MRRSLIALALVALAVGGASAWLLGQDTTWTASASGTVDASPRIIASYVGDLKRWPRWAPWVSSAQTEREILGDPRARGGRMRFADGAVPGMAKGTIEIIGMKLDDQEGGGLAFDLSAGRSLTGTVEVGAARPTSVRLVLAGDAGLASVWGGGAGEAREAAARTLDAALAALRKVAEADQRAEDALFRAAAEAAERAASDPSAPALPTAERARQEMVLRVLPGM